MVPFKLVEREVSPEVREILVEGELDLAVASQLQEAIERAGSDCPQILIGLQNCEFIDSTGIAVILQAHTRFAEAGGRVVAFAPSSQVLRILSVTGLTANGLVFASAEEALAAAPPGARLS